jgi:hypothetical protein
MRTNDELVSGEKIHFNEIIMLKMIYYECFVKVCVKYTVLKVYSMYFEQQTI